MSRRNIDALGKCWLLLSLCALLGLSHPAGADAAPAPQALHARGGHWRDLADVVFRHITEPDMRFAAAITQDGQGFLWLATQGGLVRWDGYHSKTYQADPLDPSALPDNDVTALYTDGTGCLWIGTSNGGLASYDPQLDRFLVIGAGAGRLDDPAVTAIAGDGKQGLWVGTGKGLDHLDLATHAIRSEPLGEENVGAVKALLQDPDGGLWVGTDKGLMYRPPQSVRFTPVSLAVGSAVPPAIWALLRDSLGNLWIGTRPYGAFVWERGTSGPRAVRETGAESSLPSESILSIVEPTPGEIWLGSSGRGIISVDLESWKTRRLRHHVDESSTLQDDDIHAMYRDHSGLVWVSTTLALSMHDPRIMAVSTLLGATDGDRPITDVQVPFVLPMPDGRVWLSVGDEGGIDILDPRLGRVGELTGNPLHPERNLPPSRVLTMASGPDGAVYIGTRHGLYRTDPQARQVTRVEIPSRSVDAGVYTLLAVDDVLWLGGVDGLWALDTTHRGAPRVVRHFTQEQFADQRIVTLLSAPSHTLWIGTSAGVSRLDTVSGDIDNLPGNLADPQSLWPGFVVSMLIDRQGRLWVGSEGAGIQILEGSRADGRPRFRRLGIRDGLPNMGVDKLLLDARGRVWASTDNGLADIDPDTLAVRTLGVSQGVQILAYWADSGGITADGDLLFGGQRGITVVHPLETRHSLFHPPVVVTEASIGGRPVNASRFNGGGPPPRIDVPAANPGLMVEFSALDFTSPAENHYRYRLQGFDPAWNSIPADRRLASYTNLPPGDYVLELQGSDHEPPWTATTLSIPVRVLPAWYQTLWFKLVGGLVLVLVIAALVQIRTAVLRRRQKELEAVVDQRTADLRQRSAELEKSSQELRASQQELQRMAYFDPLTGLANRRLFAEEMQRMTALAKRGTLCFTLLLLDLDRFKHINDSLGHDAGDALLVEVARRLKSVLRDSDWICRLGGDEFAILLPHSVDAVAHDDTVCERIMSALRHSFRHGDSILNPRATIGAASCPDDATDTETLYKCADLALYAAKNAGRDTWRSYSPELHSVASPV
jgi:diguanylate cyclase (GGDEF)-like protein